MGGKRSRQIAATLCCCLALGITAEAAPVPTIESPAAVSIVAPDLRSANIMSEAGINSNTVLLAAYSAMAAYESEWGKLPDRTLRLAGWEVKQYKNDLSRFITVHKNTVEGPVTVIAISGTEKKIDFKLNLEDSLVKVFGTDDKKVHRGYKAIAESIYQMEDVQAILAEHWREGGKLIITGHSLGGSVAILLGSAFIHTAKTNPANTMIIAFAAPDMANSEVFEEIKDDPFVNFTMRTDLVPRVFHVLHGGYGRNPKNINWENHANVGGWPHSMFKFLDEAFYQAALTFHGDVLQPEEAEVYVAVSPVKEKMNLPKLLQEAYANAVVRISGTDIPYTVYRDYHPLQRRKALAAARAKGAKYLLWTSVEIVSQRESTHRTYALLLQPYWYEVETGQLLHWQSSIFDNQDYTIFPLMVEYIYNNSWYPGATVPVIEKKETAVSQ